MNRLLNKKRLRSDYVVALSILITPFLFYSYLLFPEHQHIENAWFTLTLPDTWDFEYVMWILFLKLFILFLFTIWFITCVHWWRYSILITIYIAIRQIYGLYLDSVYNFEVELNELNAFIIAAPIILLIIYCSRKLNYYTKDRDLRDELFDDVVFLIEHKSLSKEDYQLISRQMDNLNYQKQNMTSEEYIKRLMDIRCQISVDKEKIYV